MLCIHCGANLNQESRFCSKCGRVISTELDGTDRVSRVTGGLSREDWRKFVVVIMVALALPFLTFVYIGHRSKPALSKPIERSTAKPQDVISSSSPETGWKPFDAHVINLPVGFEGLDPEKLCDAVRERQIKEFKGDYESTDENRKRVKSLDREPVLGNITFDSTVALPAQVDEPTFDADRKMLVLAINLQDPINLSETIENRDAYRGFLSKGVGYNKPTYTGTNAFGVQVQVTNTEKDLYEVLFPIALRFPVSRFEGYGVSQLVFQLPADKETAPALQKTLRVLAIARLRKPYMQDWDYEYKPTITKPEQVKESYHYIFVIISEFWVYDSSNGNVLERMKPRGK